MYTRGDDTTLEATHVHTRMTIQATRARSRLAERGFSRPVAPRRARWFLVWTRAHNFSCGHRSPPWKPHAGRRRPIRDAARWQTGTCQHRRSPKRARANASTAPHTNHLPRTALEKTFGRYRTSDFTQFSISRVKYFLDLRERFFRVRRSLLRAVTAGSMQRNSEALATMHFQNKAVGSAAQDSHSAKALVR